MEDNITRRQDISENGKQINKSFVTVHHKQTPNLDWWPITKRPQTMRLSFCISRKIIFRFPIFCCYGSHNSVCFIELSHCDCYILNHKTASEMLFCLRQTTLKQYDYDWFYWIFGGKCDGSSHTAVASGTT